MAVTVQHIGFTCRDKTAQEKFYVKHFGFRRARVFNAGKADEFVMLRLGGVCLELFPARGAAVTDPGSERNIGFRHLCLQVPDVAAKAAGLNADGVKTGSVIDAASMCRA
jgi:glyoxylase I family protein